MKDLEIFDKHNKCECGLEISHSHPTSDLRDVQFEDEPKTNKKRALKAMKMITAHELKLRNEGRDFFKKELLLDIGRQEERGWEARTILENVKNLLRFNAPKAK
jgi:hypothetical protein